MNIVSKFKSSLLLLFVFLSIAGWTSAQTLISSRSTWKYQDNGSNQGTSWRQSSFSDSTWKSGAAQFGYGEGDEATTVAYGPDPNNRYVTTYFRKTINVSNPSAISGLTIRLNRDDGAVVYLNGTEVVRSNMPSGTISYTTKASTSASPENTWINYPINNTLVTGNNTIAVEVHQSSVSSTDLSFDLELTGQSSSGSSSVTRGPYLQLATPTSVYVRWRTSSANNSAVRFGLSTGSLTSLVSSITSVTDHSIRLTGLQPATKYFYSVGTTTSILAGGDSTHFFITPPLKNVAQATRIWVVGDSGTANSDAQAVRDGYSAFNGSKYTNLWLMLGDNAYDSGTDSEYQAAVFNMFRTMLRQSPLWPTIGNHDALSSDSPTQSGPYFNMFTLPKNGEAGGLSSGTEAYYSFDYGNIHFICLDSHDTSRSPTGAMLTWLKNDLAATNSDWIIAFWHHPPYSKGSHDSDTDTRETEMRKNALPILEAAGVDLVLSGHSHSYERSFLIDGHYGTSNTFLQSMKVDGGSGRENGSGAYTKPSSGNAGREGAVYTVAGSSGSTAGGPLNHPAMYISFNLLGSVVLDVNGNRLDLKFLDKTGTVRDFFTMKKGTSPGGTTTTLIPFGATWKYLDNGSNQGTAWRSRTFTDTSWKSGAAELGYGDGDEATVVSYGPNASSKYVTTYFRRAFSVSDTSSLGTLRLRLNRDDGAVVYLNGTEVYRTSMPGGTISYSTLAIGSSATVETTFSPNLLVNGSNVVAVEIHQSSRTSSDISFNLELTANQN